VSLKSIKYLEVFDLCIYRQKYKLWSQKNLVRDPALIPQSPGFLHESPPLSVPWFPYLKTEEEDLTRLSLRQRRERTFLELPDKSFGMNLKLPESSLRVQMALELCSWSSSCEPRHSDTNRAGEGC
jgi:hypothetical protein